ncbi:hypothetical protein Q3G72_010701 [Acer saccharum]|nr:hypothetical protein Q3G72_010701 [Acer saccharum]
MLVDGPRTGPRIDNLGPSQINGVVVHDSNIRPIDPECLAQVQQQASTQPQEVSYAKTDVAQLILVQSGKQTTPKKKTVRNWKKITRDGHQHQIIGKISSPLQRMMEDSKSSKSVGKRQSLSPPGVKKNLVINKKKSPISNRSKLKSHRVKAGQLLSPKIEKGDQNISDATGRFCLNLV